MSEDKDFKCESTFSFLSALPRPLQFQEVKVIGLNPGLAKWLSCIKETHEQKRKADMTDVTRNWQFTHKKTKTPKHTKSCKKEYAALPSIRRGSCWVTEVAKPYTNRLAK